MFRLAWRVAKFLVEGVIIGIGWDAGSDFYQSHLSDKAKQKAEDDFQAKVNAAVSNAQQHDAELTERVMGWFTRMQQINLKTMQYLEMLRNSDSNNLKRVVIESSFEQEDVNQNALIRSESDRLFEKEQYESLSDAEIASLGAMAIISMTEDSDADADTAELYGQDILAFLESFTDEPTKELLRESIYNNSIIQLV